MILKIHIKQAAAYGIIMILFMLALAVLLILSAMLPQKRIRRNMESSADTLCDRRVFFELNDGIDASRIDRYADSILLSIAYHFDSDKPVDSVMRSEYYYTSTQNENENLRDTVTNDIPPNQQYLRYWHGSAAIVRLAHLFTDIKGMYRINAVIMAILSVWLAALLFRRRYYGGAVGFICAMTAAGVWYVPYSLEYTWTFLVMLVVSIIAVYMADKGRTQQLPLLFGLSGIVTNFLDFLTTETLTLLVPLILAVYIRGKKEQKQEENIFVLPAVCCLVWGIGYVGMWLMKWLLASIIMGENAMPYVSSHISERIGDSGNNGIVRYLADSEINNISCLFPFGYGAAGTAAGFVLLLALCYVCFVYRKESINSRMIKLYAALGAVPYVRYLALHNHSCLHYFFTYRAQAATVLALSLITAETVDWRLFRNGSKKRKKA